MASPPGETTLRTVDPSGETLTHEALQATARGLGTLKPGELQALVTAWSAKVAPRTVRRQYDTLRAILNAAVAADLISRSPCRGIRLPSPTSTTHYVVDAEELTSYPRQWASAAPWRTSAPSWECGGESAPACG